MTDPSEQMREYNRQLLLARQAANLMPGTVVYEESGLGSIGTIEGLIMLDNMGCLVLTDPLLLASEQYRTWIPLARIIRVEMTAVLDPE